jgi:hypothetical protein
VFMATFSTQNTLSKMSERERMTGQTYS